MSELFKGNLGRIRLPSLLQLLESEAFSGWLGISTVGGIAFAEGQIVQASYGRWSEMDAALELFLESTGQFRAEEWSDVSGSPICAMLPLVMEGCRMMDEWDRIREHRPVWSRRAAAPEAIAEQLATLSFDPTLSIEDMVLQAGVLRTSIIDAILREVDAGRMSLASDKELAHVSRQAPKLDYYLAMDQGRTFLLNNELEPSEVAFRAALAARPGDRVAKLQLNRVLSRRTQQPSDKA